MQVRTFVIVLVVAMVRGSNAGQDFTSCNWNNSKIRPQSMNQG